MFPRRRFLIVFLVCTAFGILYSWNLLTTNDVVRIGTFKKSLMIGGLESSTPHLPVVSIVRLDNKEKESTKVPLVETLFRGDVEKPGLEIPASGFLQQNKLFISTNGHHHNGDVSLLSDRIISVEGQRLHPIKIAYKLVHIDLKGAPPKLSYLKSFLKIASEAGANGILLEYEDMFPFEGPLTGTSHKCHFSKEQIQELISSALEQNLEVIPLIQTFGHLEFVLKLEGYRHLREVDAYPQEICPSNDKSWNMVTSLIDQVFTLHYNNKSIINSQRGQSPTYIHIGCDEVYHIGECERCKNTPPKDLFINHVIRVAKYIRKKYGVTPIIWDDMLRKFYIEDLIQSEIGSYVELMMWDYTEDVDRLLSPYLWPMYAQVFPNIWIASAFKGAFGETLHKVDIQRHALNQLSWLRVLSRESSRIRNLRGIALTGWSRYDHFSVLCELLPVAVPSLILALQIWITQDYQLAMQNLFRFLKCDETMLTKLDQCHWNGVDLSNLLNTLEFYQTQTATLLQTQRYERGWLTFYNLQHNYTSPWRLSEAIQQSSQYLNSIKGYESSIRTTLLKYFDNYVVDEWIEQKFGTLVNQLRTLLDDAKSLEARRVWERRPIPS